MTIYDYKVTNSNGELISLAEYKGKVLLIINSATECGFTPQYDQIQDLYEKYADEGFEVLDFPCNQFGHQAPGTIDEIHLFCSQRFGISFPIFDKVDVNGSNEEPLFSLLKSEKGFNGFNEESPKADSMSKMLEKIDPDYKNNSDIKWNFTKFLVTRDGNIVNRYEPIDDILDIEDRINELL